MPTISDLAPDVAFVAACLPNVRDLRWIEDEGYALGVTTIGHDMHVHVIPVTDIDHMQEPTFREAIGHFDDLGTVDPGRYETVTDATGQQWVVFATPFHD